jgi:hypothetical protein
MSLYTNPLPATSTTLVWAGASGTKYEFEHHLIGTRFNAVPGVYIFCGQGADGRWYAKYIGQTDNMSRRLSEELALHHRLKCARGAGATHICAMIVRGGDAARLQIETDLRQLQNPPCNLQ